METPDIEKKIKDWENIVKPSRDENAKPFSFSLPNSPKFYMILSIGIFLLLIFWRPRIILDSKIAEDNKREESLSLKKLVVWWLIVSLCVCGGFFIYNLKSKFTHKNYE